MMSYDGDACFVWTSPVSQCTCQPRESKCLHPAQRTRQPSGRVLWPGVTHPALGHLLQLGVVVSHR